MKKYFLLAMASATLGLTSCSPFQVKTDYAETANFHNYRTYKLRIDDLKLNDIDKDRVLNEVSKQLKAKGLSVADNPDLIVNVKASHKKVQDVYAAPYSMYGGFGWHGMGFGVGHRFGSSVYTYNSGALIIDMIDAQTQKLVWEGVGDGLSVDSPQSKQREVPQLVSEIMANYPPSKAK